MRRWLKDKFWLIIGLKEDHELFRDYFAEPKNWTADVRYVARAFGAIGWLQGFLAGTFFGMLIILAIWKL